jgi:hypothetical protein
LGRYLGGGRLRLQPADSGTDTVSVDGSRAAGLDGCLQYEGDASGQYVVAGCHHRDPRQPHHPGARASATADQARTVHCAGSVGTSSLAHIR